MLCELLKALKPGAKIGVARDESGRVVDIFIDGKSALGKLKSPEEAASVEWIEPPPPVLVVGSGQVARVLASVAREAGYVVEWIAPDAGGANLQRIKGAGNGAVVFIASEGGRQYDEEALYLALTAGARYIGLLASRQRAAVMIASMLRRGVPLEEIKKRLRSPMGLDIGAKTAGEIAVSALAEAIMEIRGGTGSPLSEVKNPYPLVEKALRGEMAMGNCTWRPA